MVRKSSAGAAALTTVLLAPLSAASQTAGAQAGDGIAADGITAVTGIRVGHFTYPDAPTGCTVVIADGGAVGGVDVRGGAPGTVETDLLDPVNTVQEVNAVVLSGGSAFGLAARHGVMRYLEERGEGYRVGADMVVPIVPGAIIFDLRLSGGVRPDADCGYRAAAAASAETVAKGGGFADARRILRGEVPALPPGENTTIAVVATNALLTKAQATKVAQMAQDGLARAIVPSHTPGDGDTVFSLATGTLATGFNTGQVGALAAEALADAVVRAVRAARGLPSVPAVRDLPGGPRPESPRRGSPRPRSPLHPDGVSFPRDGA